MQINGRASYCLAGIQDYKDLQLQIRFRGLKPTQESI